jgi:uncharacterized membrane protein YoaK (UPF0700 family)
VETDSKTSAASASGSSAPTAGEDQSLLAALSLLTLATGLVDAASVLGLGHVFTANMTGNVVVLGFSLIVAGSPAAADCALALGAFLAGAAVGGRLARRRAPFVAALALETLILGSVAVCLTTPSESPGRLVGISMLAVAMGIQNASVRKLAVADMTTTVLTLTLTGLASDSSLAGGQNPRGIRRVSSVLLMLLGAVAGAALLRLNVRLTIAAAASAVGGATVLSAFSPRARRVT